MVRQSATYLDIADNMLRTSIDLEDEAAVRHYNFMQNAFTEFRNAIHREQWRRYLEQVCASVDLHAVCEARN